MNRQLFLHIGYPKTGTTTLQKYLFPHHNDVVDISYQIKQLKLLPELMRQRENTFLRHLEENKQRLLEHIVIQKGIYILSEESLLSYSMFFQTEPAPLVHTPDPAATIRKLKLLFLESGLFDEVKIIITIRRQDELLKSLYAQMYNYTFKHYSQTSSFAKYMDYVLKFNSDGFLMDTLYYFDIVNLAINQFGNGNVKVLVFEKLKADQNAFIGELCEYLGIDTSRAMELLKNKQANAKSSSDGYQTDTRSLMDYLTFYKKRYFGDKNWRISNQLFGGSFRSIKVPGKVLHDVRLSPGDQKRIADYFKESNQKLDDMFHLNLKEYSYY